MDSLGSAEMGQIAADLFDKAKQLRIAAQELLEAAQADFIKADTTLAATRKDSTLAKALLDSLLANFKETNACLKKASKRSEKAAKTEKLAAAIPNMDSLGMRNNLPRAWKQVLQLHDELYPPALDENLEKEAVATNETKKEKAKPGASPVARKYDPLADVMLNPPVPPCVVAVSSRDEFSGEISREMAYAELFRYTNPALKTYLQGKTHVICEAALASTGTKASLLLRFKINDPNARKAFGRLEKNSVATLKFLDGTIFELQNTVADDGVFSPDNETSIFAARYPLSPEALKKLRRTGLDKIRILWSKGYDDYEVQQVDLLMRQAACLFK